MLFSNRNHFFHDSCHMTNIPYFYIFKYLNKWKNLVQLYTIFWQCLLPKVTTIWDKKTVLSRFTYSFLFRRQYRGIYKRIHMHEIIKIATVLACVCVSFVSAMHLS